MSVPKIDSLRASRRLTLSLFVLVLVASCGDIACPESSHEIEGVCVDLNEQREGDGAPPPLPNQPSPERCDGVDNDFDDEVDEPWPELGQPCGPALGQCAQGIYVCSADGASLECEGGVGPSVEVCDGIDNDCDGIEDNGPPEACNGEDDDCDGFIDEGVLSIKQETFDRHATVAATTSGFVLTSVLPNEIRVETYDTRGNSTSQFDDIAKPHPYVEFIESSAREGRVLVGFGKYQFYVMEAEIRSDGAPIVLDVTRLHDDWNQGVDFGIYAPPMHPRLSASPARFVGFTDLLNFRMTPIGDNAAADLAAAPLPIPDSVPVAARFDVGGPLLVWEQTGNVRIGWVLSDGTLGQAIDVAAGTKPAIGVRNGGAAVAYLSGSGLRLTELDGFSLQCGNGRLCNAPVEVEPVEETHSTTAALAYLEPTDTWIIAVDQQLLAVGHLGGEAVVHQSWSSPVAGGAPARIDVESHEGTAAILQSTLDGDSVLTFMGCF